MTSDRHRGAGLKRGPGPADEEPPATIRADAHAFAFEIHDEQSEITDRLDTVAEQVVRDRATLTALTGSSAGAVLALDKGATLLGRSEQADMRFSDPGVSRRHARILRWLDLAYILEDLGSSNGTFINGKRTDRNRLQSGDRIQLGPNVALSFQLSDKTETELQQQLYQSSTHDGLTQLYNKTYATQRLQQEVSYARRHDAALAILIIDLDHFKRINDEHGHLRGDVVLQEVASRLTIASRTEDVVARFGGEEFLVILRGTPKERAELVAERMRDAVRSTLIRDTGVGVTVSIGVACLTECEDASVETLLERADARLYAAKASGRDRVCSD